MTKAQEKEFTDLFVKACGAGLAAGDRCTPVPMIVSEHVNPLNDNSPVKKSWHVPSGVCGFAWVSIRPGNSPFANWLKSLNLAKKDSYEGGVKIWIHNYGQSLERKEAYAHAFAEVLRDGGIKAYSGSRMD